MTNFRGFDVANGEEVGLAVASTIYLNCPIFDFFKDRYITGTARDCFTSRCS